VKERNCMFGQRRLRVGLFRLITPWPFPDERIGTLAGRVEGFVVPELNLGQMSREVQRAAGTRPNVISVTHAGGTVHDPEQIYQAILEAVK
jgi:2-oxoglutarate ferredoxin oxidoreductase subunit alpha